MDYVVTPARLESGRVTVPGDKSISHRALLLGSLATGKTEIRGFLAGDDCLATLAALRAMGVGIAQHALTEYSVDGVGLHGLNEPRQALDLGNSGTAIRLLAGVLSGQAFKSELTGDASLRGRPMGRITKPLHAMGAHIASDENKPPLVITGRYPLTAIDYALPVASAQVKSAILLAGLFANGVTRVREPAVTRDHTERMLRRMGVPVSHDGSYISVVGESALRACSIDVPADLSSASFLILATLLADNADVLITNVGINPTRTGVIDILVAMGADIQMKNTRLLGEEPVADIRVRASALTGGDIDPAKVSLAIDEFPVLFVAAAAARGTSRFSGIGELRVKESDRIRTMANGLRRLGIDVQESDDGAVIEGGHFSGGKVDSCGDHRVAMSLAVAASIARDEVRIVDVQSVDTSFPGFATLMRSLGLAIAIDGR